MRGSYDPAPLWWLAMLGVRGRKTLARRWALGWLIAKTD